MATALNAPLARLARTFGQALITFAAEIQPTGRESVTAVTSDPFAAHALGSRQLEVVKFLQTQGDSWVSTRDVSIGCGYADIPNTHTTLRRLEGLGIVELREPPQVWRLRAEYRDASPQT